MTGCLYLCARLVQSDLEELAHHMSAQNVNMHASLYSAVDASAVMVDCVEEWWAHQQSLEALVGVASRGTAEMQQPLLLLHTAVQLLQVLQEAVPALW